MIKIARKEFVSVKIKSNFHTSYLRSIASRLTICMGVSVKKYITLVFVIFFISIVSACSKSPQLDGKELTDKPLDTNANNLMETKLTIEPTNTPTMVPEEANYIVWKDKGFEALIREVINKPVGNILYEDAETIRDLWIVRSRLIKDDFLEEKWDGYNFDDTILENSIYFEIKDWSDLAYLKNLNRLILLESEIKDISFLEKLSNITYLNIALNEIEDSKPLSYLKLLQKLYLRGNEFLYGELGFLYTLPIKECDFDWNIVYYPFQFKKEDMQEGISSGNLVNGGFVAYDGTSLYTMETSWGDLPHGSIIQYHVKENKINYLNFLITEQMANLWQCEPGGYINEDVRSLNYYKDHIYYISNGTNNATADCIEDGYYPGDETYGIMKCNVNNEERELLTTESFTYLCVARNHIYGVNDKNEFVRMSLEGEHRELVVKEECSFAYVNDEVIYYLTKEDKNHTKQLMQMKVEGDEPQMILEGTIRKPIFHNNFVFYIDERSFLYRYDMSSKENFLICEYPIQSYNVDQDSIYVCAETGEIVRMDQDGRKPITICDSKFSVGNIQVIGDYLFVGNYFELWKIKKDGTEYNNFHIYW